MHILLAGVACALLCGFSYAQTCERDPQQTGVPCAPQFTYRIQNLLSEPSFAGEHNITIVQGRPLIWYMEKISKRDPNTFQTFALTYYPNFGYFIQAINGVFGNWEEDKTYWALSNSNGDLNVGVSSYQPADGDVVLFDFIRSTQYA